jgi:hypothetical protein
MVEDGLHFPIPILRQALRVRSKITSGFGGSAAWPWGRREEGASPLWGCARRATTPKARRRPAPEGWGDFGFWLRCSSVTERRLCSFVAPRQKPKSPPAKPEVIFELTLSLLDFTANYPRACNVTRRVGRRSRWGLTGSSRSMAWTCASARPNGMRSHDPRGWIFQAASCGCREFCLEAARSGFRRFAVKIAVKFNYLPKNQF